MAVSRSECWRRGWDSNPGSLRSTVFKSGSRCSRGSADDPIHEGIDGLPGLESADVRLRCYRLLLPARGPSHEFARCSFSCRDQAKKWRDRRDSNPRPPDPRQRPVWAAARVDSGRGRHRQVRRLSAPSSTFYSTTRTSPSTGIGRSVRRLSPGFAYIAGL